MLITTENEVIWGTDSTGGAAICFKEPVECPRCHRMVCLAVNRDGKTLCVVCDAEVRKAPKKYEACPSMFGEACCSQEAGHDGKHTAPHKGLSW